MQPRKKEFERELEKAAEEAARQVIRKCMETATTEAAKAMIFFFVLRTGGSVGFFQTRQKDMGFSEGGKIAMWYFQLFERDSPPEVLL